MILEINKKDEKGGYEEWFNALPRHVGLPRNMKEEGERGGGGGEAKGLEGVFWSANMDFNTR